MTGWRTFSIVAHIVQFVFLFVLLWHYDFVSASSTVPGSVYAIFGQQIPGNRIKEAIDNPDALKIAYDVGVLEIISLSLTLFAILLGIGAFFGFWMIRASAMSAAAKAARDEMQVIGEKNVKEWVETYGRSFFETAAATRRGSSVPAIPINESDAEKVINAAVEIKD